MPLRKLIDGKNARWYHHSRGVVMVVDPSIKIFVADDFGTIIDFQQFVYTNFAD